jgi:RNA polymerase sigma factor for flagellar operon FliA
MGGSYCTHAPAVMSIFAAKLVVAQRLLFRSRGKRAPTLAEDVTVQALHSVPPPASVAPPPFALFEEASPESGAQLAERHLATKEELAELVERYRPVVLRIAAQIHRRSPPSIQRDDLVAAGMSGLWDALRRRDERPPESFDFYVCTRVRGAIIDELRAEDWLPRRRGRNADGTRPERTVPAVVHYEDLGLRDRHRVSSREQDNSEDMLAQKMTIERVLRGLDHLPARERYVLVKRDLHGVPIKDLGEELGVSKPRVCQLRTQALRRLREYLDTAA